LVTYQTEYNHYPETLGALAANGNTTPSETGAMLIDDVLATGSKTGYHFTYEKAASTDGTPAGGYIIVATPLVPSSTGVRSFFSDETGVIRFSRAGPADKDSPPLD
jgi:hypothetical protein